MFDAFRAAFGCGIAPGVPAGGVVAFGARTDEIAAAGLTALGAVAAAARAASSMPTAAPTMPTAPAALPVEVCVEEGGAASEAAEVVEAVEAIGDAAVAGIV
ncbi:hypothetical protein [Burkholderia oklahomensis]|uniref:hypothetical protein n=1 Tax=Burkholderia oklahomensis TaxID=342113 RepID=UPI0002E72226